MKLLMSLLIILVYASDGYAGDGELVAGCNDCHGQKGVSTHSDVPTIAGFSETSISDMLLAFVDETRPAVMSKYRGGDLSRPETSMVAIAKKLSEEDIAALAAYYSGQAFKPAKQKFDAALAAKGAQLHENRCAKCHEDGGSSADDDAGILAGQWSEYLQNSFDHFKHGRREDEAEMVKKIKKLSDVQIKSLIHYYASLQ